MIVFFIALTGCIDKGLANEYVFSEPLADWYVIVNGVDNGGGFIEGTKRRFVFPESGILVSNIKDFAPSKYDVFKIGEMVFDPNSTVQDSYKLCYHMISVNSGYDDENFDFYFFRVAKTCEDESKVGLELYFDRVLDYLKNAKIQSSKQVAKE
ncbi:MAG: hypothetical protein EP332_05180 [Bacteroidetes bacterium]|nr:MAG: hypothetical protein EP332_05180 [Bacteroidota bacterium]